MGVDTIRDWPVLYTVGCRLLALLGGGVLNDPLQLADVLPSCLRELEGIDEGWWLIEEAVAVVVMLLVNRKGDVAKAGEDSSIIQVVRRARRYRKC